VRAALQRVPREAGRVHMCPAGRADTHLAQLLRLFRTLLALGGELKLRVVLVETRYSEFWLYCQSDVMTRWLVS